MRSLFASLFVLVLLAAVPAQADQLDLIVFAGDVSVTETARDPPEAMGSFYLTLAPRTALDETLVEVSYRMQTFINLPRSEFVNDPSNHYTYLGSVDGCAVRDQLSEMLLSSPVLGAGGIINAAEAVHGIGLIAPASAGACPLARGPVRCAVD